MKKAICLLTVLALLMGISLWAFADTYNQVNDRWIASVNSNSASGTVTFNMTSEFVSDGTHMWTVAIYNTYPSLPNGDEGFWNAFNRGNLGALSIGALTFGKHTDYVSDSTYVCGAYGGSATSSLTISNAGSYLTAGTTYYAVFAANNDGANGWSWVNKPYAFTYGSEPTVKDIALANGTILNLNELDLFNNTDQRALGAYDGGSNDATTTLIDTELGKAIKIVTSGNSGINEATNVLTFLEDPNNGSSWSSYRAAFEGKITASATAYIFRVLADGDINLAFEPIAVWPQAQTGSALYLAGTGEDITLITADGSASTATLSFNEWNRYVINLPNNFNGYVVIPTSRFSSTPGQNSTPDVSSLGLTTYMHGMKFFVQTRSTSAQSITLYDSYYTSTPLDGSAPIVTTQSTTAVLPTLPSVTVSTEASIEVTTAVTTVPTREVTVNTQAPTAPPANVTKMPTASPSQNVTPTEEPLITLEPATEAPTQEQATEAPTAAPTEAPTQEPTKAPASNDPLLLIICIALAVLLVAVVVVFTVILKKKSKKD